MNNLKNYLIEFCRDEEGLTTVEYAVAGSLVAAAVVTAFEELGTQVGTVIDDINTDLGGTPTGAGG
ncbi:Flp family type IVb pilin [uncultured Photobacterium sp.]|uniref:Flp family type IVb pilin n=1 Tax=uncultured Photobacterium sp. TaxID=173973 RepID=UPI002632D4F7|nr:Flp family type IVb pilin [uncultured Photobacterium sp.]